MRIIQLAGSTIILALTINALAQSDAPAFEHLDVDDNGYISRSEAEALPCLAEEFHNIETRSEKGLDRKEYQEAFAAYCQIGR